MAVKRSSIWIFGLIVAGSASWVVPSRGHAQTTSSSVESIASSATQPLTSGITPEAVVQKPAETLQPANVPQRRNTKSQVLKPPADLQLEADRQSYDSRQQRFVAIGHVVAKINGGTLRADRIEFDSNFNTLYAIGSVRFRKGAQYLQASTLRYSLIQNEGELKDVYGVLDLDTAAEDLTYTPQNANQSRQEQPLATLESESLGFPTAFQIDLNRKTAERISKRNDLNSFWEQDIEPLETWSEPTTSTASALNPVLSAKAKEGPAMACPPPLPKIPDWHPHPWAMTAWGGQMIDSNFGDTFLFTGRMRPEYLLGVGMQKRIYKAGPFAIELEADLFGHHANQQPGGRFNQSVAYADTPSQSFGEGIMGIGARLWVQPWLSFGFVQGLSYNTAFSNYERTYRENYSQLLNYLGFELEAEVFDQLSLVGRIHHRSGAFGTYSGVKEGSNAYLIGMRYRWGKDHASPAQIDVPPPLGCPGANWSNRKNSQNLSDALESITLGDGDPSSQTALLPVGLKANQPKEKQLILEQSRLSQSNDSNDSLAEQEALRAQAIARIDQRINSIQFQQRLIIERRLGVPSVVQNVDQKNEYGGKGASQLKQLGDTQLITGTISRWRIQAAEVIISPDGWQADRMSFTNDPYTPAQTRIDAEGVVAKEQANGDLLIETKRNRLIVEERLPIPVSRTQRIKKEEEVENRWVFGIDNEDRDGFFVGRDLKPIEIGKDFALSLQPQFLVQRAINNETNSYVEPGSSINSPKVTQPTSAADLFGLEAELAGKLFGWKLDLNADLSTFNPQNFADGSRYWADLERTIKMPLVGNIKTSIFGAFRYKAWNGSLGETDIYSAYGAFAEKQGIWRWGKLKNSYLLRAGAGNYQAETFTTNNLTDLWRANLYGSLNSSYPIWRGKHAELTPEAAYRYSPVAIIPGLSISTNFNTSLTRYGNGTFQNTFSLSGGPNLTLGTFSKPFLDFTRVSVSGGAKLKQGSSPFGFDQAIDLGTMGIGITQQIAGPLVLNAGAAFNVDPASEFYGDVVNSSFELRWQRRSYDFGFYFNPYKGIGGFRFRLNDFNFRGSGVPFVPYNPIDQVNHLGELPI